LPSREKMFLKSSSWTSAFASAIVDCVKEEA
jgi:hypothetical protein